MKRRISQFLLVVMVLGLCMNNIPFSVEAAVQAVTVVRSTDTTTVHPGEEIEVTLNVTGSPDTTYIQDSDIMLVIDKSGSMGEPGYFDMMTPTKEAAKEFIDAVNFDHHQVGVVDFSDLVRTRLLNLSQDSDNIKSHIDTIVAKGGTYTDNAINLAKNELLNNGRPDSQKVIILLTDGAANDTNAALRAAEDAKAAGIVFYTIAALSEGANVESSAPNKLLVQMATTGAHHHFVLGAVGIDEVYKRIAKEIGVSAAYNVSITETVADQFEIVPGSYNSSIPQPTVKDNTLVWNMNEVKETTFQVKYKVKAKSDTVPGTYNISSGSTIQYYDYVGKEYNFSIKNTSMKVIDFAPVISSTSIEKANVTGGESITIKGEYFREGATVKFGTKLATDVVVVDSNTITATVPAGSQGSSVITVTNPDGQSATYDFYYYANPEVTSLTPVVGPFIGGQSVYIRGAYFMPNIKVYFGEVEATSVSYYNSTYILVKTPQAEEAGLVDIKLVNGDGTETILTDAYTYEEEIVKKLEITSIDTTSATVNSTIRNHIYGDNIEEGCKVYFGDQEANIVNYYNKQHLLVDVPANSEAEIVDVKIENPDGTTAVLENAFEYYKEEDVVLPGPKITTISNDNDTVKGGSFIYIEGANFQSGLTVTFGDAEATVSNYYSANKIRVKVPAYTEGVVSITLTNPDGQSCTLEDCFEYTAIPEDPAPEITALSADTDSEVGGSYIYIEGLNFKSGLSVMFGDVEGTVANYYSAKKIRVKVPANKVGVVSITITNPDGQKCVLDNSFTYTVVTPTITKLSVIESELEGGITTIIYGSKFDNECKVYFGDLEAEVVSATASNIKVVVPESTKWGTVNVSVVRASGAKAVLEDGFTYNEPKPAPKPTISYISTKGTTATTVTECSAYDILYIVGTNFNTIDTVVNIYNESGDLVETVTPLNRYSSVKLRYRMPKTLAAGEYTIKVANIADGTESTGSTLTVK